MAARNYRWLFIGIRETACTDRILVGGLVRAGRCVVLLGSGGEVLREKCLDVLVELNLVIEVVGTPAFIAEPD
jgi:hypothetical protein